MLLPAGLVPQLKVELYDCDWGKDDDLLGSVKHSCSAGGESISLDLKPDQHLDISTLRGQMGCTFSYRFVPGPPPTPPATRLEISAICAFKIPNLDAAAKIGSNAKAMRDENRIALTPSS